MTLLAISSLPEPLRAKIRKERRDEREAGKALAAACRDGDLQAFHRAADFINNWTLRGWRRAIIEVLKLPPGTGFSTEIQQAFLETWIENKSVAADFEELYMLTDGLRRLLQCYVGPSVKLYRGAFWRERTSRVYGISWTAELGVAEQFATDSRQFTKGGSCILQTDAPREAIIATAGGYYSEKEFLLDRRRLGEVRILKRFPQLQLPDP